MFRGFNCKIIIKGYFKKNGCRLSYDLKSGNPKWFEANAVVDVEPIYILDKENNIIAIKEIMKDNVSEN